MGLDLTQKLQRWSCSPGVNNQESLSLLKLQEIVQLPKIFMFIDQLFQRYKWQKQSNSEIFSEYNAIRERMNEKRLFLGVIGEFNAGKSTFINALLEDDLLTTSIIQATTASITKLEFGENLAVEIKTTQGKIKKFTPDNTFLQSLLSLNLLNLSFDHSSKKNTNDNKAEEKKDQIRKFINKVTADENIASQISEVRIFHPSNVLQDNLIIIDTPGTNSNNSRHTQLAKTTVEEICDVVLVVVPVTSPFSQTIVEFLKKALGDSIHRCIFIGSQNDKLDCDEDEDVKMRRFFKEKIQLEFDIPHPEFFFVSAKNTVDSIKKTQLQNEDLQWFRYVRNKLRERMLVQRHFIQCEKISRLTIQLTETLQKDLKERLAQYDQQHQALIDNMIPNIDSSWGGKIERALNHFDADCANIVKEMINNIYYSFQNLNENIKNAIYSAQSTEQLQNNSTLIKTYGEKCNNDVKNAHYNGYHSIQQNAHKVYKKYIQKFQHEYVKLASLGGNISTHINFDGNFNKTNNVSDSTGNYQEMINENISSAGFATFVWAANGAIWGQILIPVPVLGAVIGGLIGSLFTPSLASIQADSYKKISASIDATYRETINNVNQKSNEAIYQLRQQLQTQLSQTIDSYRKLAAYMQERDIKQKKIVENSQRLISEDIRKVGIVKDHLQKSLEKIKNM